MGTTGKTSGLRINGSDVLMLISLCSYWGCGGDCPHLQDVHVRVLGGEGASGQQLPSNGSGKRVICTILATLL